jgi:hypothetical protein
MDIRAVARQLQSHGEGEDKILAHINAKEAALLARIAGGNVNPKTGLPQFGLFSNLLGSVGGLVGLGGGGAGGQAASQTQALAQPILDESNKLLKQYDTGQLNTADATALASGADAAKSAAKQYYSNAGLGTSSAATQALGQIDINEAQTHQNLLNNYLSQANTLFGTAYAPLSQAISYQFGQNTSNQSALGGLIGNIFGSSAVQGGLSSLGSGIGSLFSTSAAPIG